MTMSPTRDMNGFASCSASSKTRCHSAASSAAAKALSLATDPCVDAASSGEPISLMVSDTTSKPSICTSRES
eukprot:CAMPEP_0115742646 /NCGR_PEP_ID=MMETSP0272-20121206/90641_1 /TAXON_ID=71861 /ORGANISM="Scrippsiella trochoidea, Strain CCMP3099" /LENGTH=71 /DNA_ID=CAMNT_0003187387 /DNA_START=509 /DNA_END=724 /DNA_ORIENTATION=-